MKSFLFKKVDRLFWYFVLFFSFSYLLYSYVINIFVESSALKELSDSLSNFVERVERDLQYQDGSWDLTLYNADPDTPHPNGSSGFSDPLYIITTEGYVIERSRPVNGLLDASDPKPFYQYADEPSGVNTITNENWRLASKVLYSKGQPIGLVLVGLYNADNLNLADKKIMENMQIVYNAVEIVKNDYLDVSKVDIRLLDYDIAFEIIDRFHRVLINNGRLPTYIDPSYVYEAYNQNEKRVYKDFKTGESYLLWTKKVTDPDNNNPLAIILAGKSLSNLNNLLNNMRKSSFILYCGLLLPLSVLFTLFLRTGIAKVMLESSDNNNLNRPVPKKISFNISDNKIWLDQDGYDIPAASNQYRLCQAMFSFPDRIWDQDDLTREIFQSANKFRHSWRTIYDTAIAINKKLGLKLLQYHRKKFQFNPDLLLHIKSL